MFGVIGPDGAGKTTLFRILATLISPDSGSVNVLGNDIIKDSLYIRKDTGYMPQRFSLYQDLTVEENLSFYADLFKVPKIKKNERTKTLLGFSKLEKFTKFKASQLSGGMKQKLALCCALIHTPKLLILDEPTTGVDPVSRREFWEIIMELKKEKVTIIFSTPYMDEASKCDRLALIYKGKILLLGTEKEIIANFTGSVYEIQGDNLQHIAEIYRKIFGAWHIQIFGDRIHISMQANDKISEISSIARDNNLNLKSVKIVPSSIEDTFVNLIKEKGNEN